MYAESVELMSKTCRLAVLRFLRILAGVQERCWPDHFKPCDLVANPAKNRLRVDPTVSMTLPPNSQLLPGPLAFNIVREIYFLLIMGIFAATLWLTPSLSLTVSGETPKCIFLVTYPASPPRRSPLQGWHLDRVAWQRCRAESGTNVGRVSSHVSAVVKGQSSPSSSQP